MLKDSEPVQSRRIQTVPRQTTHVEPTRVDRDQPRTQVDATVADGGPVPVHERDASAGGVPRAGIATHVELDEAVAGEAECRRRGDRRADRGQKRRICVGGDERSFECGGERGIGGQGLPAAVGLSEERFEERSIGDERGQIVERRERGLQPRSRPDRAPVPPVLGDESIQREGSLVVLDGSEGACGGTRPR